MGSELPLSLGLAKGQKPSKDWAGREEVEVEEASEEAAGVMLAAQAEEVEETVNKLHEPPEETNVL